jgi:hypothetical protein
MGDGLGMGFSLSTLPRRPILLWETVRVFFALRSHRGIFPSSAYVAWRVHTAYGDGMSAISAEDLTSFVSWRRLMRAIS